MRWTSGEVARLRRHLKLAYEEHGDGKRCAAVAEVGREWGISSSQVRAVIARADRQAQAEAATTAAAGRTMQPDIYHDKRWAIIARLEKGLHPHTPWRDPREVSAGMLYRADNTPWENTLAGACVWLRKNLTGTHDCSSDLLWCIVMQERCESEALRVAVALKHAWLDKHAAVAKLAQTPAGLRSIEQVATIMVLQCVTGVRRRRKIPVHWQLWHKMQDSGEVMLWGLADRASRRAVAALR